MVAADAVAALGGSAMAVEVVIDQWDDAYVTRVDAAPPIDRLSEEAHRGARRRDRNSPRCGLALGPLATACAARASHAVLPRRARMLGHRQGNAPAEAQPGFILTYHGSDIGVVERIDVPSHRGIPTLHVRGGISGSLRYAIPASAVSAVFPDDRRVALDDRVTFEPEAVGRDGEVLLVARNAPADWRERLAAGRERSSHEQWLPRLRR